MNIRKITLLSNIVLLIAIFTSLLWNINSGLFFMGLVIGAVVALPSVISLISPERMSDRLLVNINLTIMLVLSVITLSWLYDRLLIDTNQPVVDLVVVLFLDIALCASIQLLVLSSKRDDAVGSVDSMLHSAYGGPSIILMLSIAIITTGMLQSLVFALSNTGDFFHAMELKLLKRGIVPYLCLVLFFWGILLLIGNYVLLRIEQKQAAKDILHVSEATSMTCKSLQMLFAESRVGTSKAKKRDCIEQLADQIWHKTEYLYSLSRYINWAIPILGFIGTVLGISLAAESIGGLISSPDTNFSSALGDAIAPLGIAFDTTLVALSLSVVLMLVQTLSQRWQERQLQQLEQNIRDAL